jgi:hypothetical protein
MTTIIQWLWFLYYYYYYYQLRTAALGLLCDLG